MACPQAVTGRFANGQGLVAQSLVSTNRWLRGIKTYRFPWYLMLVNANHASSNPGQFANVFDAAGVDSGYFLGRGGEPLKGMA